MCKNCEKIRPKTEFSVSYAHLRYFYYRYSDDLLSHDYYFCSQCSLVWREDDCSYPIHSGFFWKACTLPDFIALETDTLPKEVQRTPHGIKDWIESFNGYFAVDLFSHYYTETPE